MVRLLSEKRTLPVRQSGAVNPSMEREEGASASLLLCRYVPWSMPVWSLVSLLVFVVFCACFSFFSLLWYVVMRCLLPEVFLEAVPLPSGRGVTVYISPPPYLVSTGLGNVVVVVVVVLERYLKSDRDTEITA
ncbi:hypothetical protein Tco_0766582 [Tanacetum coccineum]